MIWAEGSCLANRTLKSCFSAMWNLGFEWGEAHHPVMTHLVFSWRGNHPRQAEKGKVKRNRINDRKCLKKSTS